MPQGKRARAYGGAAFSTEHELLTWKVQQCVCTSKRQTHDELEGTPAEFMKYGTPTKRLPPAIQKRLLYTYTTLERARLTFLHSTNTWPRCERCP